MEQDLSGFSYEQHLEHYKQNHKQSNELRGKLKILKQGRVKTAKALADKFNLEYKDVMSALDSSADFSLRKQLNMRDSLRDRADIITSLIEGRRLDGERFRQD